MQLCSTCTVLSTKKKTSMLIKMNLFKVFRVMNPQQRCLQKLPVRQSQKPYLSQNSLC